ncbi:hypothetical protein NM688_g5517 [Phlebia brevispora]|uniref:Uncharacterized protein n=1 Tax=Phlebia brevispora TaxID=194682 RepID=A0ACC1SUB2_9APHY|nr:hypothetical protein NM688_g5517 [Phlebia brevispora]
MPNNNNSSRNNSSPRVRRRAHLIIAGTDHYIRGTSSNRTKLRWRLGTATLGNRCERVLSRVLVILTNVAHVDQALNSFDALKEAWSTRKLEIEARVRVMGGAGLFSGGGGYGGYGGYGGAGYGQAQEVTRLEQMAKQAESNADTVVAAKFQMQEVHSGYRQSGDLASKKRVRESINAALTNLPDWPPQNW